MIIRSLWLVGLLVAAGLGWAEETVVHPGRPNAIEFEAREARFVRLVIRASSGGQPCLDELEVYGPAEPDRNLALAADGAKPGASSCLSGYAVHRIAHLNDGVYGNDHSWIAATGGQEWAQVELPGPQRLSRVVFSRDRQGRFVDRVVTAADVLVSADGTAWERVARLEGVADPAAGPGGNGSVVEVGFRREHARFVRLLVLDTSDGQAPALQEVELYGVEPGLNLALAANGSRVTVSSGRPGSTGPECLNDGAFDSERTWVAAGPARQWVQVELPRLLEVDRLVACRDRSGRRGDGVPTVHELRISQDGQNWKTLAERGRPAVPPAGRAPVPGQTAGPAAPRPAADLAAPRTDDAGLANLALNPAAKPAASSCLPGHAIHQTAHLNDGRLGNDHSWISNGEPSWAEVDLGGVYHVCHVAFGSDSSGRHRDRSAVRFDVQVAVRYDAASDAPAWTPVVRQYAGEPVTVRTDFRFRPVAARWVRVCVGETNSQQVRIDELEVYGQADPLTGEPLAALPATVVIGTRTADGEALGRDTFVAEEHAWLKTYGRADLDTRLADYVRVWQFPRHVGDDLLPLPTLTAEPAPDGDLADAAWQGASAGAARVAMPDRPDRSPLVTCDVRAGLAGDALWLAVRTDRLLCDQVALVTTGDWKGGGMITWTAAGLRLVATGAQAAEAPAKAPEPTPLVGAADAGLTTFEVRLPLALLPGWRDKGVRVGVGLGGRHTGPYGRPVEFAPAALALAPEGPCVGGTFRVRLTAAPGAAPLLLHGNRPELAAGLTLPAGSSRVLDVPATRGPIGPQFDLEVTDPTGTAYSLHLFRYDPLERTLGLMADLADRLAGKGLNVAAERTEIAGWRDRQTRLLAAAPDPAAERQAFLEARLAKRRLFLREPDLAPIEQVLFEKRHPFQPSHNYSDYFDSAWRPGGGVFVLRIPRVGDRLEPTRAEVRRLFDAGSGVTRNPMADFALNQVYFGYRSAADAYYHIMSVAPDGSDPRQLTDGPYHDFWPCPLPDGDLAFISTRCKGRFLCWRPQASVLFRMRPDGSDVRPLSVANLTEWGPSVTRDGRLIWQRSEYVDKGADFSHTLWTIHPDGSHPELVFGNSIIQPNGYASGREVPGTAEVACVLISHFGDLNGPVALVDTAKGRSNPAAITSLTPEVPWSGMWPAEECFREPVPIARDYILCAHAPRDRFGLFVIDRFGNRELLYLDPAISSTCPTPFRAVPPPPVLAGQLRPEEADTADAECVLSDVYAGISPAVKRGAVAYLRVTQEVRADLDSMPDGGFRQDHPDFMEWYATPVHRVSGPYGWTSYVAKASHGLVPVAPDGSARFTVPAGKVLYFQALDKDLNELQRMRSVVQFQPGEKRSCIGCHEPRQRAPGNARRAALQTPQKPRLADWEGRPFAYEEIVQPVFDRTCTRCHHEQHKLGLNLKGTLDADKVPASFRTLVGNGLVHYFDYSYNPGGNEKAQPLTFGTLRSRLWTVLNAGHNGVTLSPDDTLRLKTWIDLNCPLWPDYRHRDTRPGPGNQVSRAD